MKKKIVSEIEEIGHTISLDDYTMRNNQEQWIAIEGYSKYETKGEIVRNKRTGRIVKPVNGRYMLYKNDSKKQYAICVNRLKYAILHRINPDKLDGIWVVSVNGKIELKTRYDYLELIRSKIKPKMTGKEVVQCNLDALYWLQKVKSYYDTGDITDIALELSKYKKRICAYIVKRKFTNRPQILEDVWSYVYEVTLSTIVERKSNVLEPFCYMSKVAVSYFSRIRKMKRVAFQFDESRDAYCF